MKKKSLKIGVFQGFMFNIIIFIIFIVSLIYYVIPEILAIEKTKKNLTTSQNNYSDLISKGLTYDKFISLSKTIGKKFLEENPYEKSILEQFTESDYENHFINNSKPNYEDFIKEKSKTVKSEREELEGSDILKKVQKILPYYVEDSNLSEDGLTDFKFVNYIETLLHNFILEYNNDIGIGDIVLEEPDAKVFNKDSKGNKEDELYGQIYSFKLPLHLVGKKKRIIDFLYYIENVGSIMIVDDKELKIKEIEKKDFYINENGESIKNDFKNLQRYFLGNKDIYNNMVVDIANIKFKEPLDSLNLPIYDIDGQTFLSFIKNDQGNEEYEIDLELKFYVKGLPLYKTKEYIKKTTEEYNKIKTFISKGIVEGEKNKAKLNYSELSSLEKLKEYNIYLSLIEEDINSLNNPIKLKDEIGNIYKLAQKYNSEFEKISELLTIDLKVVSEDLYDNFINKQNKKENE